MILCWLDELASLPVCDEIVVFSIMVAESCLIRGNELRQKRKDWSLRRTSRSVDTDMTDEAESWLSPSTGRWSLSSMAESIYYSLITAAEDGRLEGLLPATYSVRLGISLIFFSQALVS